MRARTVELVVGLVIGLVVGVASCRLSSALRRPRDRDAVEPTAGGSVAEGPDVPDAVVIDLRRAIPGTNATPEPDVDSNDPDPATTPRPLVVGGTMRKAMDAGPDPGWPEPGPDGNGFDAPEPQHRQSTTGPVVRGAAPDGPPLDTVVAPPFEFRWPDGSVTGQTATTIVELDDILARCPHEVIVHHAAHHDISRWVADGLGSASLAADVLVVERAIVADTDDADIEIHRRTLMSRIADAIGRPAS